MSYGGLPRDYEMPTKDPDKEDETEAENKRIKYYNAKKRIGYERINYGKYSDKTYSYKDLKKAFEKGYNNMTKEQQTDMFDAIHEEHKKLMKQVQENANTFGQAVIKLPQDFEVKCNHKWVAYHGLIETYHFCEHCDEKRK